MPDSLQNLKECIQRLGLKPLPIKKNVFDVHVRTFLSNARREMLFHFSAAERNGGGVYTFFREDILSLISQLTDAFIMGEALKNPLCCHYCYYLRLSSSVRRGCHG